MEIISARVKIGNNFKIDDDGLMVVKACILKEGVFPYLASEFIENGENKQVNVYIPASEFTPKALESGQGADVIIG